MHSRIGCMSTSLILVGSFPPGQRSLSGVENCSVGDPPRERSRRQVKMSKQGNACFGLYSWKTEGVKGRRGFLLGS